MPYSMTRLPSLAYRVCWGDDPLALAPMDRIRKSPGRFDDPDFRYRVHYSADTMAGAYVEVLASLRANAAAMAAYAAVDGPEELAPIEQAVYETLEPRSACLLIVPHQDELVDIAHAQSRFDLETRLGVQGLKDGDFRGSSYDLPRRASRVIYDDNESGVAIMSAEGGVDYAFRCFAVFEEKPDAGTLRVQFVPRSVEAALNERIALEEAVYYLGLN